MPSATPVDVLAQRCHLILSGDIDGYADMFTPDWVIESPFAPPSAGSGDLMLSRETVLAVPQVRVSARWMSCSPAGGGKAHQQHLQQTRPGSLRRRPPPGACRPPLSGVLTSIWSPDQRHRRHHSPNATRLRPGAVMLVAGFRMTRCWLPNDRPFPPFSQAPNPVRAAARVQGRWADAVIFIPRIFRNRDMGRLLAAHSCTAVQSKVRVFVQLRWCFAWLLRSAPSRIRTYAHGSGGRCSLP
jgi:hypothetical protein